MKTSKLILTIVLYLCMALSAVSWIVSPTLAQEDQDNWAPPVNLSSSGAASDPAMVVDSLGVFHTLWKDEFAGLVYVSGDGEQWSDPEQVILPFSDYLPRLLADGSGNVHAFWVDEEGALHHGRVASGEFRNPTSWRFTELISDSALDYTAAVDQAGQIQLAYIRSSETPDAPAGVYTTRLGNRSLNWSTPTLVYESAYLRSILPEEANISVSAGGTVDDPLVFVAWDNPLRERVFLVRSDDGGDSWGEVLEVDKPEPGSVNAGPSGIKVDAIGDDILLLWQSGKTETSCDQFYQWSKDGGSNWGPRQRMFEGFLICPDDIRIMRGESGPLLLLEGTQVYLQAWDGTLWSDPQLQELLTSFIDPETQKAVNYECLQPVLSTTEGLYVAGCDSGEGKDIWLTKRPVGDISLWFPQEPVWNPLISIAKANTRIIDPIILTDTEGRQHAFWSQTQSPTPGSLGTGINYTRQEAGQWLKPIEVTASPQGKSEQPSAVVDASGKLSLVWSGGLSGEVYFSQANAGQAMSPTSWLEPVMLPAPRQAGSSPIITADRDNTLYAVYAIPLNENRGIYLTRSVDGGATWSDPVQVFDGVAAGWEMVDTPRLALTENGDLHLLWTRYTLPSGAGPLALMYARSSDGGITWTAPEMVEEGPITWSKMVGIGDQTVERVWQEESSGGTTLWHEESLDGGATWKRTAPASVFGEAVGTPSLSSDTKDRLNLLQMVRRSANSFVVQHLVWNGQSWTTERSLDLAFATPSVIGSLMSVVNSEGVLGAIFTSLTGNLDSEDLQEDILFTSRVLEREGNSGSPQATSGLPPTASPLISSEPTVAATPNSSPTAAPSPTVTPKPTFVPPPDENSWLGSAAGAVVAGLIVISVIIGIIAYRKGRFHF